MFKTKNVLIGFVILIAIGLLAVYIINIARWIGYPHQMDYGEAYVMHQTYLWVNGLWTWDIHEGPPYMVMAYGPMFDITMWPVAKFTGFSLVAGRITSVVCTVGCFAFIYLIVKRLTRSTLCAAVSAILSLMSLVIKDWSIQARPVDMMAFFWGIVGLYLFIRFFKSKWIYLSIIFYLLSVFTKQNMIVCPLVSLIYLALYNRKSLEEYSTYLIGFGAIGFIVGNILTENLLFHHMFTYNLQNPATYPIGTFLQALVNGYLPVLIPLVISLIYVFSQWRRKEYSLPGILLVCALAINVPSLIRANGFLNYEIEAMMFLGMVFGMALFGFIRANRSVIITVSIAGLLIALIFSSEGSLFDKPNAQYDRACEITREMIRETDKPVLTENAAIVLNEGKQTYFDPCVYSSLINSGLWDKQVILNDLKEGNIEYIILRHPHDIDGMITVPEIIEAIDNYYSIVYYHFDNAGLYSICVYRYGW